MANGSPRRGVDAPLRRVALALGVAAPAASASAAPVWQVISVKAVQSPGTVHGHSLSFTETLWQHGKKVGHDAVTCTFPNPSPTAVGHCTGVAIFPGSGDLFISATTDATDNGAHGRVGGGTGVFTNAEGKLLVTNPNGDNIEWITFTFHVQPTSRPRPHWSGGRRRAPKTCLPNGQVGAPERHLWAVVQLSGAGLELRAKRNQRGAATRLGGNL
jgi:hypothetical protein